MDVMLRDGMQELLNYYDSLARVCRLLQSANHLCCLGALPVIMGYRVVWLHAFIDVPGTDSFLEF